MNDPDRGDLAFVIDAHTAGAELTRLYRAAPTGLAVDYKGPRDLVTRADHASEAIILAGIRERFPDDDILAEESGGAAAGGARLRDGRRTWIVDPLDGTTNYAHGHPLFAVSIGLWEAGRPQLAVIHAPALGETYSATRGGGAHRDGERLTVSAETRLDRSLLATGFSYSRAELADGALELFRTLLESSREVRRGGSACLDLAHTAAGVFAGFWEYHLAPHDVAAGVLLVTEAGGEVTDVRGGDDFLFGRSIVCGAPAICRELLGIVLQGPSHPGAPGVTA